MDIIEEKSKQQQQENSIKKQNKDVEKLKPLYIVGKNADFLFF